jgi:excisionase family DNA binding protein
MMAQEKELLALSVQEAGRLLGLSRGLMYEAVRTGQITHIRIGRRILIPRMALVKLLEGKSDGSNEGIS